MRRVARGGLSANRPGRRRPDWFLAHAHRLHRDAGAAAIAPRAGGPQTRWFVEVSVGQQSAKWNHGVVGEDEQLAASRRYEFGSIERRRIPGGAQLQRIDLD